MAQLPRIKPPIEGELFISEIEQGIQLKLHKISFEEDEKDKPNRLKNITFKECIFSHQTIENISFLGCKFIDCQFNGTQIKATEFHKCTFQNSCFYKAKFHDVYIDPNSFKFNSDWHRNWPNVNAWLFQSLYRNSKIMHQENFAMSADHRFLFYKRHEHLRGQNPSKWKFIKGWLFAWILGNGYGLKNTIIITLISIITFAALIQKHIKPNTDSSFLEALYLAVVSFTTVGYGDITPEHNAIAISLTIIFLISSAIWGAVMTAIIIKRIVK